MLFTHRNSAGGVGGGGAAGANFAKALQALKLAESQRPVPISAHGTRQKSHCVATLNAITIENVRDA